MGKRTLKPAPAAPDIDDDLDLHDEQDGLGHSIVDDEDDDLWDSQNEEIDDEGGEGQGSEAEDAPSAAEGAPGEAAPPTVAVRDEFTAFVCATLPAKMRSRPLADQSNAWLLSAIGRVCDEIATIDDPDDESVVDLELDLLKLHAAAALRGINEQLANPTRAFIADIAARIDTARDGGETAPAITQREASERDTEIAEVGDTTGSLAIQYVQHARIHPDPQQPRVHADDELRDSIRANGILQPILVRALRRDDPLTDIVARPEPCAHCGRRWTEIAQQQEYVIVDGERRWRGADEVLAELPVIVRADQAEEYERLKTQLVANTGKPLTPIEEARTYARMLKDRDVGIAGLGRDIGKPASTINDRLKLLELGPWLPWIESGSVTVSMAVEHLVPLRGIPNEFHEQAIAKLAGEHGALVHGEVVAESIEDFGHDVAKAYDAFMYPLTKTKSDWEKQPLFNTKQHDAECECGGIKWGGSWQGLDPKGRLSCGNPDWWKPLHAAAKKADREKAKDAGDESTAKADPKKLRIELPAGTPTIHSVDNAPKLHVVLTDGEGKWKPCESRWDIDNAFDPADLAIDDTKLERLKEKYSYGLDRVVTRDVAAVEAARKIWRARFEKPRAAAAAKLLKEFEKLESEIYAVKGPGVHALLDSFDIPDGELREIAELLEVDVPDKVGAVPHAQRSKERRDWIGKTLKRRDAERLLSFLAFLSGSEKRQLPSKAILLLQQEAFEAITRKRSPWATTRAPKPAAEKKNAGGGR